MKLKERIATDVQKKRAQACPQHKHVSTGQGTQSHLKGGREHRKAFFRLFKKTFSGMNPVIQQHDNVEDRIFGINYGPGRQIMDNRRTFLKKSMAVCAAMSVPGCSKEEMRMQAAKEFGTTNPKRALILWYSQTGHTKRYGKHMAHVLKSSGLEVQACDIRDCKDLNPGDYDLVMAGAPVHYMDLSPNVRAWFGNMETLDRTAVASYTTFGGPGDNQHNTAHALLSLMVQKGGVPAGMATFGNMSTYAPTWSMGNEKRTLKYGNLPNAQTYSSVRKFAQDALDRVRKGQVDAPEKEFDLMDLAKHLPVVWGSKVITTDHRIIEEDCIGCKTCVRGCPVGAINLEEFSVDDKKCVLCLGCVNNCPEGAVHMKYMGKRVVGFPFFLREQGIVLMEPDIADNSA